ncbi:MAG: cytochrome-c peroxidase [Bacillota bacterium]
MPKLHWKALLSVALLGAAVAVTAGCSKGAPKEAPPAPASAQPAALAVTIPSDANEAKLALGKQLFFDTRLSGDRSVSCATCHAPDKAWADGKALSDGYLGTLYFRNTPTLLNVATNYKRLDWDGRFTSSDMDSLVRDRITESHFGMLDGRLMIERLKQVPEYEALFQAAYKGEPSFGRTMGALSTFVKSLKTGENGYDKYLKGDKAALSPAAARGAALFTGKANCAQCHAGPNLTDGGFHNIGVAENPEILKDPLRIITMRKFLKTHGVSGYAGIGEDPGLFVITEDQNDWGKFRTPSLREVALTAPYMHNGALATLEDVVAFYNNGGGDKANKSPLLKPLGLTGEEQKDLVEFLKALSGELPKVATPPELEYRLRPLGKN